MTDRKWTPGPWRIVWYDAGDRPKWYYCPMIDGNEGADRAVVHWAGFKQEFWSSAGGKQSEIQANARLIAAAPCLYEALAKIVLDWDGEPEDMADARAALAKAEGRET